MKSLKTSSLTLAFLLAACASSSKRNNGAAKGGAADRKTVVTVDAISAAALDADPNTDQPAKGSGPKPSVRVMPWDDKTDANDLFFIRRKMPFEKLLGDLGYHVKKSGKAQLTVKIGYGAQPYHTNNPKEPLYQRWINLKAVKNDQIVSWEIQSLSYGHWNDLDKVTPYHLAAMKPYVGGTVTRKKVSIEENAAEIKPYMQAPLPESAVTTGPSTSSSPND